MRFDFFPKCRSDSLDIKGDLSSLHHLHFATLVYGLIIILVIIIIVMITIILILIIIINNNNYNNNNK